MVKNCYQFNPESIKFEKIKRNYVSFILRSIAFLFTSALFGGMIMWVFSAFFGTPKEKMLIEENENLKAQYTVLSQGMNQLKTVLDDFQQRDDRLYRMIFETEPVAKEIRQAGIGGINRYEQFEKLNNAELLINTTNKLDKLLKQAYIQSKSYDELEQLANNKKKLIASVPAIMPISKEFCRNSISGWGFRIHPIYKIRKFHFGVDFPAPRGTEIYATGDGIVKKSTYNRSGYGKHVIIDHDFGYESLYAHMMKTTVKKGQKVKRGNIIGYVGNTGLSIAPHVHYEVKRNGEKVNPANYFFNDLTVEEYCQLIENGANSGQSLD